MIKLIDTVLIIVGCCAAIMIGLTMILAMVMSMITGHMGQPPIALFAGLAGIMGCTAIYVGIHVMRGDL